mmetsp:Transcript_23710/g.74613  ORF Transcript_23710/g.74613 Transcript_23710/m.74613 type:complete len:580 (+) Transcript_23710:576-2315(+)
MVGGSCPAQVACARNRTRHRSSSLALAAICSTSILLSSCLCHQRSRCAAATPGLTPGMAADHATAMASANAAIPGKPRPDRVPLRQRFRSERGGATPSMALSSTVTSRRTAVTGPRRVRPGAPLSFSTSAESHPWAARSVSRPAPRTPCCSQATKATPATRGPSPAGGLPSLSHMCPASSKTRAGAPPRAHAPATAVSAALTSGSSARAKGLSAHSAPRRPRALPPKACVRSEAERARSPVASSLPSALPLRASSRSNGATTADRGGASPLALQRQAWMPLSTSALRPGSCEARSSTRRSAATSASRAGSAAGPTSRKMASASESLGTGASAGRQSWPRRAKGLPMPVAHGPSSGRPRSRASSAASAASATPSSERILPLRALGPGGSISTSRATRAAATALEHCCRLKLRCIQTVRRCSSCSKGASVAKRAEASCKASTKRLGYFISGRGLMSFSTSPARCRPARLKAPRRCLARSWKSSGALMPSAQSSTPRPKISPGSPRSSMPSRILASTRRNSGVSSGTAAQSDAANHSVCCQGESSMSKLATSRTTALTRFVTMTASWPSRAWRIQCAVVSRS